VTFFFISQFVEENKSFRRVANCLLSDDEGRQEFNQREPQQ